MKFQWIHGLAFLLAMEQVCLMLGEYGNSSGLQRFGRSTENSEGPLR